MRPSQETEGRKAASGKRAYKMPSIKEKSESSISSIRVLSFDRFLRSSYPWGSKKTTIREGKDSVDKEFNRCSSKLQGMASDLTRNHHQPQVTGGGIDANTNNIEVSTPPELLLQWGSRKRLRCVKLQHKDGDAAAAPQPATAGGGTISAAAARADRALRRAASAACKQLSSSVAADAVRTNGGVASPAREKGAGRSPERNGTLAAELAWPKLELVLTNKEKEEDYLVFKGSKLPQRPKKRTKPIQRTINLVCPGGWLCDLTIDRYEVREKKSTKKRPMGLKAMGNVESDSE